MTGTDWQSTNDDGFHKGWYAVCTRNDTDDDGYLDGVDRYMGDMVVRLTIPMEYKSLEDINGGNTRNIFFVIYSPTGNYSTKRR